MNFPASWRTWSLAVKATPPLVQPTVRAPPLAPSPPSCPPVVLPLAAPAPALHSLRYPPRCFLSLRLYLRLPLHPLLQWLVGRPPLWLRRNFHFNHLNTSNHQLRLGSQAPRNAVSSPAGLVHLLLLRPLLLHQVSKVTQDCLFSINALLSHSSL